MNGQAHGAALDAIAAAVALADHAARENTPAARGVRYEVEQLLIALALWLAASEPPAGAGPTG
jgi:hypothetical protein